MLFKKAELKAVGVLQIALIAKSPKEGGQVFPLMLVNNNIAPLVELHLKESLDPL